MSLTAYNFQFYTYNMPTHRSICDDNGMDVDDIDMSIPPPKPPRASALFNNSGHSWMTSTPKSILNETLTTPTATTAAINYLTVPNETPKSIYSSGMLKSAAAVATTDIQTAKIPFEELQLRPKLHATQKRWSSELREKALEMSKRSSAAYDEDSTHNIPSAANDEQQILQLTPQNHAGRKSWSCEIREKALEMSKRNSGSFDTSPVQQPSASVLKHFGFNSTPTTTKNPQNSLNFQTPQNVMKQKPLINAGAYEKMNNTATETTNNSANSLTSSSSPLNSTFGAYFKSPKAKALNTVQGESQDPSQSVKDRICFFNKLTLPHSNSFIDLLKQSKPTTIATIQHSASAQNTPLPTPLKPQRWSAHLELNLQTNSNSNLNFTQPITNNKASNNNIMPTTFFQPSTQTPKSSTTSLFSTASSSPSSLASTPSKPILYTSTSSSSSSSSSSTSCTSTTQRKSTLRRRSSVDKTRRPIVRQNSNASSNGTKPQMHTVMEDLSLVMPVKLRVAEYERRIMMEG